LTPASELNDFYREMLQMSDEEVTQFGFTDTSVSACDCVQEFGAVCSDAADGERVNLEGATVRAIHTSSSRGLSIERLKVAAVCFRGNESTRACGSGQSGTSIQDGAAPRVTAAAG